MSRSKLTDEQRISAVQEHLEGHEAYTPAQSCCLITIKKAVCTIYTDCLR